MSPARNFLVAEERADMALHQFFRCGETNSCQKGATLDMASKKNKGRIFLIGHGYISISSAGPDGRETTHIIYGPGDIFPLLPAVEKSNRALNYYALTKVHMYGLEQHEAFSKITNSLTLSNAMLERVMLQFANAANNITNLGYKRANDRLIYCLLSLGARFGCRHNDGVHISKVFSHRLLSSMIHTSRETVTREFHALRKKNLISVKDREVILPDAGELSSELNSSVSPYILSRLTCKKECRKHEYA